MLALDGGGIRGLIPAQVLKEAEAQVGRPIAELFGLIAWAPQRAGSSPWD